MSPESSAKSGFLGGVPRWAVWAVALALVIIVVGVGVALWATSSPAFLARYGSYQTSYKTLQTSGHKNMACSECHLGSQNPLAYRIALVGDFYVSLFTKQPDAPMFAKLEQPTRDECLKCHAYDWSMDAARTSKVPHPAHLRTIDEPRDCVTCHRWVGHEEVYAQQHKKMPFSVVCASFGCHVGTKPPADCKNCHHQLQQSLDTWKQVHPQVVRSYGANACLEQCHNADQCRTCHTTGKTPVFSATIAETSTVTAIERAHVKSDWLTQHGTFALQDQAKCLTCHVTLQECQDCHSHRPAFHGTDNTAWIGMGHEKLAKDPRRCFECHQPKECNDCHQQFGAKVPVFETTGTP